MIDSLKSNELKTAIESVDKHVSYQELWTNVNCISDYLLARQLNDQVLIGVKLDSRLDLIVSMIGVMMSRCVFVPLDSDLPERRIREIIADLNLKHVIVGKESTYLNDIEALEIHVFEDILSSKTMEQALPQYTGEDSIYVYFTSGTTGRSKGIVGKNNSLIQFLQWEINEFHLDETIRSSQFITPYFDAFLRDVFVSLLVGGTVCISPDDDDFYTPSKMREWLNASEISLIHCVPSVFKYIVRSDPDSEDFPALKYILLSGERIMPSDLEAWYRTFDSRVEIINLYGTTEATMVKSFYRIKPSDINQPKISIGNPIADASLLVSNKDLKPSEKFVTGELHIVSKYVTKGYLNDPDLTHAKFIKTEDPEVIAYRTGDKARTIPNNVIDLIGREDRQVKLRGIRVELDYVEQVIKRSNLVGDVVVIKHTMENEPVSIESKDAKTPVIQTEHLVCFVIKSDTGGNGMPIEKAIEPFLREQLPTHMIPSIIQEVTEFPLSKNGKINYRQLSESFKVKKTLTVPENEIEKRLLQIWKEILGEKQISTEDTFHSVGGDSMSIMVLIGKIYREFGVRISLIEIIHNITIKKQAELIKSSKNWMDITKAAEKSAYRLSKAQGRIYYESALHKDSLAFNIPTAWKVQETFDMVTAQKAFEELLSRHEALRTRFISEGEEIFQIIDDQVSFQIEQVVSKSTEELDLKEYLKPFDLMKAPLIRCVIISQEDGDILLMDMHHIICDGVSVVNLLTDLLKIYYGDEPAKLPLQFKDYSEWENEFRNSENYKIFQEFWNKSFKKELPKLNLPTKSNLAINRPAMGGNQFFQIDRAELTTQIEMLKEKEVSSFAAFFAVQLLFLSHLTGQEDLVVGTNSSGRIHEEFLQVVGMFTKTLPIRYELNTDLDFLSFAKDLNRYLDEAIGNQLYDLVDIIGDINKTKGQRVENLFETMFVYQNFTTKKSLKGTNSFKSHVFEDPVAKYPLSLFIRELEDLFLFRLEYQTSYFSREDGQFLVEKYRSILNTAFTNPNEKISKLLSSQVDATEKEEQVSFNF